MVALKLTERKAGFYGWENSGRPCYPALSFIRTGFRLENATTPILPTSPRLVC